MSRLASLAPSGTPSRSRTGSQSPAPSPSTSIPGTPRALTRQIETTHHRMIKLVVSELKSVFKTWDELVLVDGVKAGKGCIDEATEMDNVLALPEGDERPSIVMHLEKLYEHRQAMQAVLGKLDKALVKLGMLIDQAEKIFFEAYAKQGWEFALVEPLWSTWTMETFVNGLPSLLSVHNDHLVQINSLATTIVDPDTSFDDAKLALERWRDFALGGERWNAVREWEELVDLELTGGGMIDEEEEEEVDRRKSKKKGGKR